MRGECRIFEPFRSDPPRNFGNADPALLGDVIFFVKQESLNGLLVQPRITPQLLRAARDGILFRDFYANSIQSIRGYECILCGVPPNVTGAMVDEYTQAELKDLSCIPRMFRSLGYHPLYFFGGSRNHRIVSFAESIGFERVLADDIMRPGDTNCDGHVDFADINGFVQALSDPSGYQATHPTCAIENADINSDGQENFGDINPFVLLLSQ